MGMHWKVRIRIAAAASLLLFVLLDTSYVTRTTWRYASRTFSESASNFTQRAVVSSVARNSCPAPFTFKVGRHKLRNYHQHKAGGKTVNFILAKLRTAPGPGGGGEGESVNYKRYQGGEIHGKRNKLMWHIGKMGRKSRFITFVREPAAKIMSRFYYHREMCNGTSWLGPSWKSAGACCLSLGEYVAQRAANNNQYEGFIAGRAMGPVCSPSDPEREFEPSWEKVRRGKLTPEDVCPAGREAFIQRAEELLEEVARIVFFGIVERWDESLLLLSAMGGFDPVSATYCRKNAVHGAPKPRHLEIGAWGESGKEILQAVRDFNALDGVVYDAATRLFEKNIACWNNAAGMQTEPFMNQVGVWQNKTLAAFQEAQCNKTNKSTNKHWNKYNPMVLGVPDGKLNDPAYSIPKDLPIMLSRTSGNMTCPELLRTYSDCPHTKFLEPC